MDDGAVLAALAAEIRAAGGKRCRVCLNYIAQPFCGMTGKPHKVPLPVVEATLDMAPPQATSSSANAAVALSSISAHASSSSQGQNGRPRHTSRTKPKRRPVYEDIPKGELGAGSCDCAAPSSGGGQQQAPGRFPLSDDVLFIVFSYLLPWEVMPLRVLCRDLWNASLHPMLWKHFNCVIADISLLEIPDVFKVDEAARVWRLGLQNCVNSAESVMNGAERRGLVAQRDMPQSIVSNGQKMRYAIFVQSGVLKWRRLVERLFPANISSLKERVVGDVLGAILETNLCEITMKSITMSDVDDLHELLSRTCDAHQVLSDTYDHLRAHKRDSGKLAVLHQYVKRLQDSINIVTKIDQWMNCVTDLRYWEQLRLQYCTLPAHPAACSVVHIMMMLETQPHFKDLWDFTISKANDAFDSEAEGGSASGPESDDASSQGIPSPLVLGAPPLLQPAVSVASPPSEDASVATILPTSEYSA
eukprot:TRINITY_DN26545_c0_g1_i1.p1 TRINITY_DN26545_c0_g1~~TRINITY_DN26545_c0_g1_i1.p1  ORF type:complete len:474 (+),score=162.87 TRINITY_DN26545_c0_g1_i1:104-1525(+)